MSYDEANIRLWLRLLTSARLIEKRLQRGLAGEFATTLPRFDVLATLERAGKPMAMGELSRALLVSNGNVTAIVKALERDGYVALRAGESDRRKSLVSLTGAGRVHFAELAAAHHGWVDAMLSELAPDTRDRLDTDLATLKHMLSEGSLA